MTVCTVDGCLTPHLAKGLCSAHYQRLYKRGSLRTSTLRGATVIERIAAKVERSPEGCWIFRGCLTGKGYGHIRVGCKMRMAHVVTYEAKFGPVPEGMELDHARCQRRDCCNPDHVEPVTHAENIRRAVLQADGWGVAKMAPAERVIRAQQAANARWNDASKDKELI